MSNVELGMNTQEMMGSPEANVNGVIKTVPYDMEAFIPYIGEAKVNEVIYRSHNYDSRIVAWDLIRRHGDMSSTLTPLTAVEGYLVAGLAHDVRRITPEEQKRYDASPILTPYKNFDIRIEQLSPEAMHSIIAEEGEKEITSIKRDIPPAKRSLMWSTLTGEKVSVPALVEIELRFRSILSRMRAIASLNPDHKTKVKPAIESAIQGAQVSYIMKNDLPVKQMLPKRKLDPELQQKLVLPANYPSRFDPSTGEGIMGLIGKVGNPLVRAGLDAIDPQVKENMRSFMHSDGWR